MDKGVVLLDIGFTGSDPNHGEGPRGGPGGWWQPAAQQQQARAQQSHACAAASSSGGRCSSAAAVAPCGPHSLVTCCRACLPGFLLGTRQTLLETFDGGNTWAPREIEAAKDEGFNYRCGVVVVLSGVRGWNFRAAAGVSCMCCCHLGVLGCATRAPHMRAPQPRCARTSFSSSSSGSSN